MALCYGWIDGLSVSGTTATTRLRFSPRRPGSNWSAVNVARFAELCAAGRVQAPGLAAYERRDLRVSEERPAELAPALLQRLQAESSAWRFWQAQPPGYRRQAAWWLMSAKQQATQERRLATLIADCAAGRRTKAAS